VTGTREQRAALVAAVGGVLCVSTVIAGVGVALPEIGRDLEVSGPPLQWVVTSYNLALAALTLVYGSLADRLGRRRMFVTAVSLFTAGSLASAVAGGIGALITARALAGVGAAGVMSCGGALLAAAFTGPARIRVFAVTGTAAGTGVAFGPFLSGALVSALGWRAAFTAFALAGAVLVVTSLFAGESRASSAGRPDVAGMVLFASGLALVVFGLTELPRGWPAAVALACGPVLLAAAFAASSRARSPVLDLGLLRDPGFMGWTAGTLFIAVGFIGVLVHLPVHLQGAAGMTPRDVGGLMLLLTVPVLVLPLAGAALVGRGVPARGLMVCCLVLVAAGNGLLALLDPAAPAAGAAAALLTTGLGTGLAFGITDSQAMNRVAPEMVGMASGVLNTLRNTADALVIAIVGAALAALVRFRAQDADTADLVTAGAPSGPVQAGWLTEAWHAVGLGNAALLLGAALLVHLLLARAARSASPRLLFRL
jgi:MFS family permease